MSYKIKRVASVAEALKKRAKTGANPLKSPEFKALIDELRLLPANQRKNFGAEVNQLKNELEKLHLANLTPIPSHQTPLDVTAPWDVNGKAPLLLESESGSKHPVMAELELILNIFARMGFEAVESRQLDDDWHMFGALNFPDEHPARDDYDTFVTEEKDKNGRRLVAPAHTSTMQNRVMKARLSNLKKGEPIAVVIPGRVFRNEDLDARHEHTFYQLEGVFVDKGVNVGHLIATLKSFLTEYFGASVDVKTQPFYFPFTEPSFELVSSCPFCSKKGCGVCSYTGWIELLGCGMIHPNVLKMAGIDPKVYTGFAWGLGIERPVMIKHGIEDIRHFESGSLNFLRQFS